MSPRYMEALSEVDYILSNLDYEELKKIPENFRDFISKNKDKRKVVTSADNLKEETLAVLAIIYRKFLASSDEKVILEKVYHEQLKKEKMLEKNNVSEIKISYGFETPKIQITQPVIEERSLVKHEELKWYEKIVLKIKSIFSTKFSTK